ncbi:MAG TPA: hypothetical protein VF541_13535, partial [Longimicrobium sp.]
MSRGRAEARRRSGVWAAFALLWAVQMAGQVMGLRTVLPPDSPEWPMALATAAFDELTWTAACAAGVMVAFRVPLRRGTLAWVMLGALAVLGARLLALAVVGVFIPTWEFAPLMQLVVLPSTVPVAVGAVAGGYALKAAFRLDDDERRVARLRAEVADHALRSARAGVSPRLLLRALRCIAAMARADARRADAAVCRLGDYLRLAVDGLPGEPVSVAEEVECMRACVAVEGSCRPEGVDFAARVPHALREAPVRRRELQAPLERMLARHAALPGRLAVELEGWARDGRPWFRVSLRRVHDGEAPAPAEARTLSAGWKGPEPADPPRPPPAPAWTEE